MKMNINIMPITMKAKFITSILGAIFMVIPSLAQDKTTVRANSSDISDNLDLRAVATIFGDSKDLEDFERRLNDPKTQISNLDLNNDNYVDYLRVIETVEGNAHIIVIQAVLDKDLFQDIASVEVEKDSSNNVVVQVVGDVYMYGNNYIYEPVYVHRPVIYTTFWAPYYRPYYSIWYWNYYPTYYSCWRPFPIFRYRNHIAVHINFGISFNYVSYRRCGVAYNAYYGRRANGYERRYPNRSFAHRNSGYTNRYELDRNRTIRTRVPGSRELAYNNPRSSSVNPRNYTKPQVNGNTGVQPRTYGSNNPRGNSDVKPRTYSNNNPRNNNEPRVNGNSGVKPRTYGNNNPRGNSDVKPRTQGNSTPRNNTPRIYEPRKNSSHSTPNRNYSEPRRGNNNGSFSSGGNRGGNSTPHPNGGGNRSSGRGNSGRSGRI